MTHPTIGILGWEAGNADTLAQLEAMPGNVAHPATFDFPVIYRRGDGAYYETAVVRPSQAVLIEAAQALAQQGVAAIATGQAQEMTP